jgi:hypothetical protein
MPMAISPALAGVGAVKTPRANSSMINKPDIRIRFDCCRLGLGRPPENALVISTVSVEEFERMNSRFSFIGFPQFMFCWTFRTSRFDAYFRRMVPETITRQSALFPGLEAGHRRLARNTFGPADCKCNCGAKYPSAPAMP